MKKLKYVVAVLLLIGLVFTVAACDQKEGTEDVYKQLNALLAAASYPFTISTEITADGDTFQGRYVVTENNQTVSVVYSYEKLSTFGLEGELTAPDSDKTTVTGSVKIKGGKVIEQNGEATDLSSEAFQVQGFRLSESALAEVKNENGVFSAKVNSLKEITGLNIEAKNVTLEIVYSAQSVKTVTVSYEATGATGRMSYSFGS